MRSSSLRTLAGCVTRPLKLANSRLAAAVLRGGDALCLATQHPHKSCRLQLTWLDRDHHAFLQHPSCAQAVEPHGCGPLWQAGQVAAGQVGGAGSSDGEGSRTSPCNMRVVNSTDLASCSRSSPAHIMCVQPQQVAQP